MTDIPERIWAYADTHFESRSGGWSSNKLDDDDVECIRADIHRSLALDAIASETQAADAYDAQLKAEAMAERLAKEGANLFAEIDRSRGDIESPYVRVAFGMFQRALAEYEASK